MQADRFCDLGGIGDRAGDRGNVSFGVVQGLALEEGVVVVVSPNLSDEEEGLAEVLLALCSLVRSFRFRAGKNFNQFSGKKSYTPTRSQMQDPIE